MWIVLFDFSSGSVENMYFSEDDWSNFGDYSQGYGLYFSTDCTVLSAYFWHADFSHTALYSFPTSDLYTASAYMLPYAYNEYLIMSQMPEEAQ